MRVKLLLLGIALFVSNFKKCNASYKCYQAKICIHDGIQKCGQDMQGKVRRFLDSCDMKEYNCLKNTNYRKVDPSNCRKLPLIKRPLAHDNVDDNHKNENDTNLNGSNDNNDEPDLTSDMEKANADSKDEEANKENRADGADEVSEEDITGRGSGIEDPLGGTSKLDDSVGVSKEYAVDEADNEDVLVRESKEDASGAYKLNEADGASNENEGQSDSKEGGMQGESMADEADQASRDNGVDRGYTASKSEVGDDDRADEASKYKIEDGADQEIEDNENEGEEKLITTSTGRPIIVPGKAAVINEYWCWRMKYCHRTGGVVCGRDRRLNKRLKFDTACDLYTHNCNEGHDFTITDVKFCRGY